MSQNHNSRNHNIDDRQRNQNLPAQIHQLIVAETRQRPAHPHEKENEKENLSKQEDGS